MSVEPTACPYCNALIPLPAKVQAGQRLTCPRCGESFALRGDGIQRPPAVTTTPTARTPALTPSIQTAPGRANNRRVAAVIVTTMALMAAVGLAYALVSQSRRRANDRYLERTHKRQIFPEPADEAPAPSVAPSKLEALGYLPPNTNLVLGVNVRQLRQSATGGKLLSEPIKTAKGTVYLPDFRRFTGLEIEEIDHLVLGVRTEDDLPRVLVVARTFRPIDRQRVRSTLDAEKREGPHHTEIYRFKIPNLAPEAKMWFAEKRTVVIDLYGSFEGVPNEPRAGLDHLPFAVSAALNQRVDPGAQVWLVAGIEDWEKTTQTTWFKLAQTFVGGLTPEFLDRLQSLRVVAIGAEVGEVTKAQADFQCRDATAAQSLRTALVGREGAGVKTALKDEWLTVQWTGSLETVLQTLAR